MLLRAANLPFGVFVLALGAIVVGVVNSGLDDLVARFLPTGIRFSRCADAMIAAAQATC